MKDRQIQAVIFDLGGVVLGSPLHAIARYEKENGIPAGFVNRHVAATAPDGAWHRLERGETAAGPEFFETFDRECSEAGQEISAEKMFEAIHDEAAPRPEMLEAVRRLRAAGLGVAALTNNWASEPGGPELEELSGGREELRRHFDHFIESSVVGIRKPDPRIYQRASELLGVEPNRIAFLDDIGANLKSARALGMTTIKVDEPAQALAELEQVVGFPLGKKLNGAQRKQLRGLAHQLEPIVQIGKAGLSPAAREEVDRALDHHELIKVRVRADRPERKELIAAIEETMACEVVGQVGHVAILYRPNVDEPKIRLER